VLQKVPELWPVWAIREVGGNITFGLHAIWDIRSIYAITNAPRLQGILESV